MKLYGAIDLHSNNSYIVILDEQDRVVFHKRLRNDLDLILSHLSPYQTQLQGMAVESTFNWYWLVDGLMEAGIKVHLVNTAAVQQYQGLKHTDDGVRLSVDRHLSSDRALSVEVPLGAPGSEQDHLRRAPPPARAPRWPRPSPPET